jgi:cytochrome P450
MSSTSETAGSSTPAAPLRQIEDLPGPRGWPLFGNLPQVRMRRIHQDMEAWTRKCGPFFRVRLGRIKLLVVADHRAINAILRDRPEGFRRGSRLYEVVTEMGSTPGLFVAEGEAWRNQRRMVMASFAAGNVRAYFPALRRVALRLRARWQKAALADAPIDLQADLKRYTVDIIAGLAFGSEVNTLDSGEDVIQHHLDIVLAGIFRRAMSPVNYWRWFKLPADRRLERSNAVLSAAIDAFVTKARARMADNPDLREHPNNLLEAMIAAADSGDAGVDDRDVVSNVSTMLLAGEDTTANTLAWLIYLLHRNPRAWRLAKEEVARVAPDPANLTLEQIEALTYVDACANEAMRLKPVAPFVGLEALRDTTVADIHVPARTTVWCVLRHDSLDEGYCPNPGAFEPERWLGDGAAPASTAALRRVTMPFGSGPRLCPGRYLALLEIKLAMATLLGCFDIKSLGAPGGGEAREIMSFTMNPVGLRMRLAQGA